MKSIAQEQKTDVKLHASDFSECELGKLSTSLFCGNNDQINPFHFAIANSAALKGMLIGIALAYFSQLSGCATIILYSVYILDRTGTTLDPYKASIGLAVVLIVGNLCTTQMADTFGRKTFLIVSSRIQCQLP